MFYPCERDEKARAKWLKELKASDITKIVFLDETSTFLNISRAYGWAVSKERVIDSAPKGQKERVSLIAAIGLNANLAQHAIVHPESVDKNAFKAYLETILLPQLESGTIIVLDNWTVHHGSDIRELVESFSCKLFYLPTYSPDFNPIEYLFSKIKTFIKKCRPTTMPELIQAFKDAANSVTLDDIHNTFRHCKYLVQ